MANYTSVTEITLSPHAITNDKVIAQNFRADNERLNYIGWATEVEPAAGTTQIGTRLADPKALPFLLLSERGKGRVAYFAADLSQAYFLAPYQYERKLLSNAIRWAAGTQRTAGQIEAPCVQAAFYEQSQPAPRVVVHLLNEINTSANRAIPENNSSMREDVSSADGDQVDLPSAGNQGRFARARAPEAGDAPIRRCHRGDRSRLEAALDGGGRAIDRAFVSIVNRF